MSFLFSGMMSAAAVLRPAGLLRPISSLRPRWDEKCRSGRWVPRLLLHSSATVLRRSAGDRGDGGGNRNDKSSFDRKKPRELTRVPVVSSADGVYTGQENEVRIVDRRHTAAV